MGPSKNKKVLLRGREDNPKIEKPKNLGVTAPLSFHLAGGDLSPANLVDDVPRRRRRRVGALQRRWLRLQAAEEAPPPGGRATPAARRPVGGGHEGAAASAAEADAAEAAGGVPERDPAVGGLRRRAAADEAVPAAVALPGLPALADIRRPNVRRRRRDGDRWPPRPSESPSSLYHTVIKLSSFSSFFLGFGCLGCVIW